MIFEGLLLILHPLQEFIGMVFPTLLFSFFYLSFFWGWGVLESQHRAWSMLSLSYSWTLVYLNGASHFLRLW